MKIKFIAMIIGGAIAAQVWGTISWMALGWHSADMKTFKNGGVEVTQALTNEALESGIYLVPNMEDGVHSDQEKMNEWNMKAEQGPFAFISIQPAGVPSGMGLPMFYGFLVNILIATLLALLISKTNLESNVQKATFTSIAGGAGSLFPHMSNLIWWHFPTLYSLAGTIDMFITWFIAGYVMAIINTKK